jgi:hypothetical protein
MDSIEKKSLEKRIQSIKNKIVSCETKLKKLKKDLLDEIGNTIITCEQCVYSGTACKKESKIKDLTYIQTHWYDNEAYNEHWACGEGNFICIHCGYRNRLYNREYFEELKYSFKNKIDEYKD